MNFRTKGILCILLTVVIIWKSYNYMGSENVNNDKDLLLLQRLKQLNTGTEGDKVKVTVYYEVLCSDSRNFVLKELLPTYLALSQYMILDLVPYGKARTVEKSDGTLEFFCQHGEIECLGNKVHACTIDVVKEPMQLLNMVTCMIDDNIIPFDAAEKCAKENSVSYEEIAGCTNNIRSSKLLQEYGLRTSLVHPSFIPTVELNGEMKVPLSVILKDLKKQVCSSLDLISIKPKECS